MIKSFPYNMYFVVLLRENSVHSRREAPIFIKVKHAWFCRGL